MKLRQRSIRRSTSEMMKASLDEEPPHDMPNIATTGQQESHAATVVSPCKQSPKYTDVPKSAHQNTAPEVAGKVHNKQTTYINGMRPEKGKHRFDIQDETGYTKSVNKANVVRVSSRAMHGVTVSTEKATGNEGRDSAMSTSSAFQHSELMIFPEVRISQDFHVHQHSNFSDSSLRPNRVAKFPALLCKQPGSNGCKPISSSAYSSLIRAGLLKLRLPRRKKLI